MIRLSAGGQRAVAVLLALLAAGLAYQLVLGWWLIAPLTEMGEEEAVLQASHQRYAMLVAQRESIEARLAEQQREPLPAGSLLVASSAEAATAQVMQLVYERLATSPSSGMPCALMNRLPLAAEPQGTLIKIQVDAELECGMEALAATLHRLESEPPYLNVESFEIRRLEPLNEGQGRVNAKLRVRGFMAKESRHD